MRLTYFSFIVISALGLSSCSTSIKMEPEKLNKLAYTHYQLGIDALGKEGMLPKAFDELLQSDKLRPNQPVVLNALAFAWLLRGDMKKSEGYYRKAIQHGGGALTFTNYANLLNRLHRFPEAETYAQKALDDPRYPHQDKAFINLGDALLGQDRFEPAIHAYQQAELFNSEDPIIKFKLAHAYYQHGQLIQAQVLYAIFLRQQPGYRPAVEELTQAFLKTNKRQLASQTLTTFSQHTTSSMDKAWAKKQLDSINRHD